MKLGLEDLRELIENFLSNTGGRRGRKREQRRQAAAADEGAAGDAGTVEDESGEDAFAGLEGGSEPDPTDDPMAAFETDDRPDPEDMDDDEVVDDIYYRLEELEDEFEQNNSQLGTIQDAQQQVVDEMQEVNDRVRQLVGIYDMLTDEVNPFTGDGEERGGFGVFGEDDDAEEGFGIGVSSSDEIQGLAGEGDPFDVGTDETVSFSDLKGLIDDATEEGTDRGTTITFDEDDVDGQSGDFDGDDDSQDTMHAENDTHVEVQATDNVGSPDDGSKTDDGSDVTLESLAGTYASDVIVFEWLSELVRTAGPAATLRAISYYAEIGWIGEEVKDHLENVLSGPDLDMHVDPMETPEELTAEDHADSYTYIMKLQEIHETRHEINA